MKLVAFDVMRTQPKLDVGKGKWKMEKSRQFEIKFLIGLGFRLGFLPIFIFLLTVLVPRSLFPVLVASFKIIDLRLLA